MNVIPTEPNGTEPGLALGRNAEAVIQGAKLEACEALAQALETEELEDLHRQLEQAEGALEELRAEYANGNKAIGAAAQQGDADRLAELSLRLRSLPSLIAAAEFRVIDTELAIIAAERPIHDELVSEYSKDRIAPLSAEISRLQLQIRAMEAQRSVIIQRRESAKDKRRARLNRRDEIVAELQVQADPRRLTRRVA